MKKLTLFLLSKLWLKDKIFQNITQENTKYLLPNKVNDYILYKIISGQEKINDTKLAIYKDISGHERFVKILPYRTKSASYYRFLNEIFFYKTVMQANLNMAIIKFPSFIDAFDQNNQLFLILEKIEGLRGDKFSSEKKIEAYDNMRHFFNLFEKKVSRKILSKFTKRTSLEYFLLYPLTLIVSIIKHPNYAKQLLHGYLFFIFNFYLLFQNKKLVLSNKDFHYKNVMKKENLLYIYDFEACMLTIPMYEEVMTLRLEWNDKKFSELLIESITKKYRHLDNFEKYFKLLIVIIGTHGLTANNYTNNDNNTIKNFLEFGLKFNTKNANFFFTLRKIIYILIYCLTKNFLRNFTSILVYHSISDNPLDRYAVSPISFEKQISKIAKFNSIVSIEEALLPTKEDKPRIVITFDDGYSDIFSILPVLKKWKIKPLLFITTDKKGINRTELANNHKLLSTNDIKFLIAQGFDIGSHSCTHPDLTKISEKQMKHEIEVSKEKLESLGIKIKFFAYPKGKYTNNIIKKLKGSGYDAAFTIEPGNLSTNTNKFMIPRTIVDNTHTIDEFPALFYPSVFWLRSYTNKFKLWERFLKI